MKTELSRLELENDLLFETLKEVNRCFNKMGQRMFVVGATSRDII